MTEKIKESPFSKEISAVLNPEVVKIRTIKAKHLDQIHEQKHPPETGKILGYVNLWVIFRIGRWHPDGALHHLVKVRDIDLVSYTLAQRQRLQTRPLTNGQVDEIRDEVWNYLMNEVHQLFRD